ncbi:AraC family transcriptional regulator [Silvibacterium acidisoli]|uniref:AraC family transcriptional regulator n=1 Tax=Acidobacteriaceae bacterium ZG23-2 TaxID=2883246 RepID=UPI00406CD1DC
MRLGHRFSTGIDKYFVDSSRPVLALGGTYPVSHHVGLHSHRRSQLFCPLSGIAMASTSQGAWAVPAGRGLWIPAGVRHELRMQGTVQMQSLYIDPAVLAEMPNRCRVLGISPLMRSLMTEAVVLPVRYEHGGRAEALMRLIQFEINMLAELPLSLPLPIDKKLARLCRKFLRRPNVTDGINDWAEALHMSRRTFTRLFRSETGLSFVAWRQQACILAALPKLASGVSVTRTALDLGYENPAAFTMLFKRVLGESPRSYNASPGHGSTSFSSRENGDG